MAQTVTYLSSQTSQMHTHTQKWTNWKECVCRGLFHPDKGAPTTVNEEHWTPLHCIALALYRLADRGHEVTSSTPEADGIALLYSNPQRVEGVGGVGGVSFLCPFFFYSARLSFLSTPDSSEVAHSANFTPSSILFNQHSLHSSLIPIHFAFFPRLAVPSPSSQSPLDPLKTLHNQRQRVMWRELDR